MIDIPIRKDSIMRKTLLIMAASAAALVVVGVATAHVYPAVPRPRRANSHHRAVRRPARLRRLADALGLGPDRRRRHVREAAGEAGVEAHDRARDAAPAGQGLRRQHRDAEASSRSRGAAGTCRTRSSTRSNILLGMPNTPGKTIYFPTVQRCAKGVTRWIQIPKSGQAEPEHPGSRGQARQVEWRPRVGTPPWRERGSAARWPDRARRARLAPPPPLTAAAERSGSARP